MKRIEDFVQEKGTNDQYLNEYGDFIAKIYLSGFPNYKFRASPALNKLEAQSHLYQRILYYCKAKEALAIDPSLKIETSDAVIHAALSEEFPGQIVCETPAISVRSFYARIVFYFVLSIYFKIFVPRKLNGQKIKNIVRTYFVPRSVDKAGFLRDEYLGAFTDDLMESANSLCIYKLVDWHDWKLYRNGKALEHFNHALVENFLSLYGLVTVFAKFIFSRIRLKNIKFKDVDVTGLINEALKEEYFKTGALVTIMEDEAAKKIYSLNPEFLFYPFENQAWERVYPYQKSILGKSTRLVGFQHTGVSYKLLNYFPSKLEKKLPIYPDTIFTVGDVIKNILDDKGNFPSRIEVGGAIRHAHFVENEQIKSAPPSMGINKVVTYAFSYDSELYDGILRDLGEVFNGSNVKVYLKFHPLFSPSYIDTHYGKYFSANLLNGLSKPWSEIYRESDFILYDDNTVGFEGMINGVKTYMYRDADRVYNCKRDYFFTVWSHEVGKTELLTLKNQLENGTYDKSFKHEDLKKYLRSYFTPYVSGKTFQSIKRKYEI